jgi:hypothetical protein
MYEKPELTRFGSFREVTLGGDPAFWVDIAGLFDDVHGNVLGHAPPSAS